MPWGLKRHYGTGSLHFITWSCYRRKPLLGNPARRDLVLTAVELMRVRYRFAVIGYGPSGGIECEQMTIVLPFRTG
jgi:putative transposase